MNFSGALRSFWANAKYTARTEPKSIIQQLVEIAKHKHRNPTLGIDDYYTFRLYRADVHDRILSTRYLGWRVQEELAHAVNVRAAVLPAWDKFTFHMYAERSGLSVPKVFASFRPRTESAILPEPTVFTQEEQLEAWLRNNPAWPIFAKPCFSQQSVGCFHILGYRAADDALEFLGGESMTIESFVENKIRAPSSGYFKREMGYLFQEVLKPHEDIVALTGNATIPCFRIFIAQY
jgi:hypothetical protein